VAILTIDTVLHEDDALLWGAFVVLEFCEWDKYAGLISCCITGWIDGSCRAVRFRLQDFKQGVFMLACVCPYSWFWFALLQCVCLDVVFPGAWLLETPVYCKFAICKTHMHSEAYGLR
jgi:hypothetical protein